MHRHTNIVRVALDGEMLLDTGETPESDHGNQTDPFSLTIRRILEFANEADSSDLESVLRRQVGYNLRISSEGLVGGYGVQVGKKIMAFYGSDVNGRARAAAAAGSDARMSGCPLPVVVNSGSGNQGITVCVPIAVYAEHYNIPEEKMLRALIVANLIAIHLKTRVGRLSTFCGVVLRGQNRFCP